MVTVAIIDIMDLIMDILVISSNCEYFIIVMHILNEKKRALLLDFLILVQDFYTAIASSTI